MVEKTKKVLFEEDCLSLTDGKIAETTTEEIRKALGCDFKDAVDKW